MRYKDLLDVAFTPEESVAINAALVVLETHFERLPALTKAEMRHIQHFGIRNETFSMEAIQAGIQNPQLLPPAMNMAAVERDRVAREMLIPIAQRVQRLNEKLEHSRRMLGADLFAAARAIYKALQEYGKDTGIGEVLERLGRRFKPKGKASAAPVGS